MKQRKRRKSLEGGSQNEMMLINFSLIHIVHVNGGIVPQYLGQGEKAAQYKAIPKDLPQFMWKVYIGCQLLEGN
jgi:hypothetical protein